MTAVFSFFPITAVLHHLIFYRPTCILNEFGPDYYPGIVLDWLRGDPSPWIAALCAMALYRLMNQWPHTRPFVVAFVLSAIPITIWIWDIPFTGRIVCHSLHDGQTWLHGRHLYMLGLVLYAPILYSLMMFKRLRPTS